MTIVTREKVRAAVERALQLAPDHEAAVAAAARALALPVEVVHEALADVEEQAS